MGKALLKKESVLCYTVRTSCRKKRCLKGKRERYMTEKERGQEEMSKKTDDLQRAFEDGWKISGAAFRLEGLF